MASIASLRKAHGLSQAEFARMVGVSRAVISMAEGGQRSIPTPVLMRLGEFERRAASLTPEISPEDEAQIMALAQSQREREEAGLKKLEAVRERLARRIEKQEARHAGTCKALALIARERGLFRDVPTYLSRLDGMEADARTEWMRNHPVHRRPLLVRLAELDAGIAARKEMPAEPGVAQ